MHRVGIRDALAHVELGEHPDEPQPILACSLDGPLTLHAQWGRPAGNLHRFDVAINDRVQGLMRRVN
jgi:hypothetical protein